MIRLPVLLDGKTVGELTVERDGLYACAAAECMLPEGEPMRLYAVGRQGETRLGIPAPERGRFTLRRRIAAAEISRAGELLRGELRLCNGEKAEQWEPERQLQRLLSPAGARAQSAEGALSRQEGEARLLALPYDERRPFPIPGLFCFARIRRIGGQRYAVFAFSKDGQPVFPSCVKKVRQ
jgi:hypothetical protein